MCVCVCVCVCVGGWVGGGGGWGGVEAVNVPVPEQREGNSGQVPERMSIEHPKYRRKI